MTPVKLHNPNNSFYKNHGRGPLRFLLKNLSFLLIGRFDEYTYLLPSYLNIFVNSTLFFAMLMGTREHRTKLKKEMISKNLESVMIMWILNNLCRNRNMLGRAGQEEKPCLEHTVRESIINLLIKVI